MSDDGAHLGIDAQRALGIVLAGDSQPEDEEMLTPAQVRERITEAGQRDQDPVSYGDCADIVAGWVLAFYEEHPEAPGWGVEPAGHWERDGERVDPKESGWEGLSWVKDGPDLYDEVKKERPRLEELGITGFMWGWAVNAARYALDLPPEPNPAIITIVGAPMGEEEPA